MRIQVYGALFGAAALATLAFAGVAGAQSSTATCEIGYTSGSAVPAGYGAAYDPSSGTELMNCSNNGTTLNVGSGSQSQYIYKQGYAYEGGAWQPLNFTSQSTLVGSNWFLGSASVQLPFTSTELSSNWNYVVAYVCNWNGSAWKCGCADSACATSSWQMQTIKAVATQTTPPVSSGACPASQNGFAAITFQTTTPLSLMDSVTTEVANTLSSVAAGTSITLFEYRSAMSGAKDVWSCVEIH